MCQLKLPLLFGLFTLLGRTVAAPSESTITPADPPLDSPYHPSTKPTNRIFKGTLTESQQPIRLISQTISSSRVVVEVESENDGYKTPFADTVQKVYMIAAQVSNHSWEWGTQSQVILELYYKDLSVYSTSRKLPLSEEDGPIEIPEKLLDLLDPILARRDPNTLPLVAGDDPLRSQYYKKLADDQIEWLLNRVPRSAEGAISQRDNEVQFWSDYMYMAPPFLAYYGAATSNITILLSAYDQARLYRDKLQPASNESKLWRHIIEGSFQDELYWSTGNGWAAAGMMRIFSTFNNLSNTTLLAQTEPWRRDLAEWVFEIANEVFLHQQNDDDLIPNYMLTNDPKRNYSDCSGTALIASAAYRLVSLVPSYGARLPMERIEKSRLAVFNTCTNSTNGVVAPVVNPLDWNAATPLNGTSPEAGQVSPEGQAFVVLLHEAWEAYKATLYPTIMNSISSLINY